MAPSYRSLTQSLEDGPSDTVEAPSCLCHRKVLLGSALLVFLLLIGVGIGLGHKGESPKEEQLKLPLGIPECVHEVATGIEGACIYESASGDTLAGAVPGAHCSMGAASHLPQSLDASGGDDSLPPNLTAVSQHAATGGWATIDRVGGSYTPPTASDPIGSRVFQIAAIIKKGHWKVKNHTPDDVLALLKRMRTVLGTPFSLYGFVVGQQPYPNAIVGSSTYTLDQYLLLVQTTIGGAIIPALNLDFWIDPWNKTGYACADGTMGPECFWKTSDQMLALKAIAAGPRIASLGSWMTFNRCNVNPKACTPAAAEAILKELLQRGWKGILPANIGPFNPTFGLARGMITGLSFQPSAPWIQPVQKVIDQAVSYPGILRVFSYLNSQTQKCPTQASVDIFLANLDTSQKMAGVMNMAQSQASGKHTFVYPLWINAPSGNKQECNKHNGNPGYWDAMTALQTDQTPFFDLIMSLAKQYN